MAEVYPGFLSHADHDIGRLLDYLADAGQLDNTIIVLVSDNGASGEGGPNGSVNENAYFNGIPDQIENNLKYLDVLGGPRTYNHYPTGWACAFNTPFKLWKRYSDWEGGTADPMIVSWPAKITQVSRLAAEHPDTLQELTGLWWMEAGRYQALPLENRNALEILTTDRPQLSKPRNRYTYYPGGSEIRSSSERATRCRRKARSRCTSAIRQRATGRSRPNRGSSRSPAKGSTSARRVPSRSPMIIRVSTRGRLSAGRSRRR
jgi:hypothetical protein